MYLLFLSKLLYNTFKVRPYEGYDDIEVPESIYEVISKFLNFGFQHGLITRAESYQIAEAGIRYLKDERRKGYAENQFYELLFFPVIKNLCQSGRLKEAWELFYNVYKNIGKSLENQISEEILGFFQSFSEELSGFQFLKSGELVSSPNLREQIVFYNSKIEIAISSKDEESYEKNKKQLQSIFKGDEEALLFIHLLDGGSIRSHHQKKDELMFIYKLSNISQRVKRRTVKALIEHKTTGVQTLKEVRSRGTPYRVGSYFLNKLMKGGVISEQTKHLLKRETYPYLRQILSEFQNEFNTVIEALYKYSNKYIFERGEERKKDELTLSDWEGVLKILRTLGIFSLGIFTEAKSSDFNDEKLFQIKDKITEIKKNLFINGKIEDSTPELLAEIIYFAYKPAQMSLSDVESFCYKLSDCSHHLDNLRFKKEGYSLNLLLRKEMELKPGIESIIAPRQISTIKIKTPKENQSKKEFTQQSARTLFEIGRFKITDTMNINDIMVVFSGDTLLEAALQELPSNFNHKNHTKTYQTLRSWQELLGIYFEDNLEKALLKYLKYNFEYMSGMIQGFAQSARGGKLNQVIKNQLGKEVNTTLDDITLTSQIISKIILEKFKPLQSMRKIIKEDLKKFITLEGEEVSEKSLQLRAVISKSKASFFAKASAGICTAGDVSLFEREDHFHINIIDEEKQICIGNIQAYIMPKGKKKFLFIRGINPSTNLLKDIDAKSFTDSIIEIGKTLCDENRLSGVILSTQGDFIALSNRSEISAYIEKKYKDVLKDMTSFPITANQTINQGYFIYEAS